MSDRPLDDWLPEFPRWLGVRLTGLAPDRVSGRVEVAAHHANRNGVMHGGAIMALADSLAGTAAALNLSKGQTTTTIESKTNFLRPIAIGEVAVARREPIHLGRRTTIWQTTILRPDGKPAAIVTQTQPTIEG
ncbi:PaaI family thioesterase [Nioella aestuarii]|uniref:PaaI family thioesterase n=1 Tax=Nioella aestuarii TaxID=1662864 RepID=UPI003D7F6B5C